MIIRRLTNLIARLNEKLVKDEKTNSSIIKYTNHIELAKSIKNKLENNKDYVLTNNELFFVDCEYNQAIFEIRGANKRKSGNSKKKKILIKKKPNSFNKSYNSSIICKNNFYNK